MNKLLFLILPLLLSLSSATERPVHIFMAGDSTMADKDLYRSIEDSITGEMLYDVWPERGWGMLLPEYFTGNVIIDNRAMNGRSTKTFINEGRWDGLIKDVQKGDFVVIQFGHNDSSTDKGERYTPPTDYKKNLQRFVDEVKAKGATPVLCTPVARRKFIDGKLTDTHGVYPGLVKEVAKENKVLLIDMYEKTWKLLTDEGEEQSARLFMHIPKGYTKILPNGLTDNTHYVEEGARLTAGLFIDGLKEANATVLIRELKENQAPYVSKAWVSDQGNGQYKNPVLYADYSDPDVCRVGDDYYMTASSFNCVPGLPVLHSNDLVNWTLVNYAIPRMIPEVEFSTPQHGNGVWAPAIRYHKGEFYIYFGDPDYGIYMTKTRDPRKEWSPLALVKAGNGLIDPCPFWDDNGQAYLVHAYAGSRAGIKSIIAIARMSPDGKSVIEESKIVYDGHLVDPTIEGPKLYKKDGYYYIFAPAGGVATGWQTILRSKHIYGPYERKVALAQGNTPVNGPHQGAWIDTNIGEDWFIHFQDAGAYGRITHLQPMRWENDWPVIGTDKDGDGTGEPVLSHKKPDVGKTYPIATPVESDEFDNSSLSLQWQWHANPGEWWSFHDLSNGCLKLYSVPVPDDYHNLWDIPNLLLQKFPAPEFTATTKLRFTPNPDITGERTGLIVMGTDYALLSLESTSAGLILSQIECLNAEKGNKETVNASIKIPDNNLYLRVKVESGARCTFSYSLDGEHFKDLGKAFTAKEGKWIGAKTGVFCSRPVKNNDGGYADIDWFHIKE